MYHPGPFHDPSDPNHESEFQRPTALHTSVSLYILLTFTAFTQLIIDILIPLNLHIHSMRTTIFHMSAAIVCAAVVTNAAAILSREHCSVPSADWECPREGFTDAGPYPKTET